MNSTEQAAPGASTARLSGARVHLHLTGVALFVGAVIVYGVSNAGWGLFALLILAPDLFMVGYFANPRTGALVYNIGHSFLWPVALIAISFLADAQVPVSGLLSGAPPLQSVGIIWAAHIGMDWAFGYGYKYPTQFKLTHFQRV